jgi:hypothetical protein
MVAKFQGMLSSFDVSPYSRSQWSGYGALDTGARATAAYGTQFEQNLSGLVGSNAPAAPVTVSAATTTESFTVRESDANILDPNRPGGYTYIQNPANVDGPGARGGAVPWWMMNNPMNPMGMTGPMGVGGAIGSGVGGGSTGPMGPRGPTGPMSMGTNVGNAAPVGSTGVAAPVGGTGAAMAAAATAAIAAAAAAARTGGTGAAAP